MCVLAWWIWCPRKNYHGTKINIFERNSFVYKRLMIGPEPWNSELRTNSCVCYVVTRSTSPPGKYWAASPAFIHWKALSLKDTASLYLWGTKKKLILFKCHFAWTISILKDFHYYCSLHLESAQDKSFTCILFAHLCLVLSDQTFILLDAWTQLGHFGQVRSILKGNSELK